MPDFKEFLGPSYTRPPSQTQVQCERTVNWRLERLPGSSNKSQFALLRQPGLGLFKDSNIGARVRGMIEVNGRLFAVIGSNFVELDSNATLTNYTTSSGVSISNNNLKVWMAHNIAQVMIVGNGLGYIFTLSTNTLVQITDVNFPTNAAACEFLDGYFIVTLADSQQFQISSLNDGLTWDALDITSVESRPDNIVAPMGLREEVWFFGTETIQPYYNTNNADFPLEPNLSGVTHTGLGAVQTVCRLGNVLFWLKVDESGALSFCRNQGYVDIVVSNHALESIWSTYKNIDEAWAWTFSENGHGCVRLTFPDIDDNGTSITWEYDLSTDQWCETPWHNPDSGSDEAHRGFCSVSAFGKILVGDRENGNIYELHSRYLDDAGDLIRRVRRAPHLYSGGDTVVYYRMEFDGNRGIGLNVLPTANYYNPTAVLRWSNDGGKTFGRDYAITFGPQGHYKHRPFRAGLGSSDNRVFELVCSDPVDWAISACRLDYEVLSK